MRECQPKIDEDMDLDFFKRITREMYEAGVEEIGLFYLGESLMAPELTIAACKYLKKELGMPYVFLTTNGSLATDEVLQGLMEAGLDSLKFSLNAYSHTQFETVMGVKAKWYKKALRNLKRAYDIRNLGGFHTKIYASSIQYDGEQQQKMATIVEEQIQPFVDEFYYLPLYSMGSVATQREKELGYRPTAGNQGRIGGLVNPLPCWSLFTEAHVRSDGTMSLCCFDADGRFNVGSLHENSFMEVWQNNYFQRVRKAHLAKDLTGTVCDECVAY